MFSDISPHSAHVEEGEESVCVVPERHRINGWKLQEKQILAQIQNYYSCPKMQLTISRASQVLVVSLGTRTEIKMTTCQNVI